MSAADTRWENFIHNAIETHKNIAGWAKLTEIRKALNERGTSRAAQDAQLKRMSQEGTIVLAPESAQMLLTDADHQAAIRIGGQQNHQVIWNR